MLSTDAINHLLPYKFIPWKKPYHQECRLIMKSLNFKSNCVTPMPLCIYIFLYFEDIYDFLYLSLSLIASPSILSYLSLKIQSYSLPNSKPRINLSSHSSWTSIHSFLKSYSIVFFTNLINPWHYYYDQRKTDEIMCLWTQLSTSRRIHP